MAYVAFRTFFRCSGCCLAAERNRLTKQRAQELKAELRTLDDRGYARQDFIVAAHDSQDCERMKLKRSITELSVDVDARRGSNAEGSFGLVVSRRRVVNGTCKRQDSHKECHDDGDATAQLQRSTPSTANVRPGRACCQSKCC